MEMQEVWDDEAGEAVYTDLLPGQLVHVDPSIWDEELEDLRGKDLVVKELPRHGMVRVSTADRGDGTPPEIRRIPEYLVQPSQAESSEATTPRGSLQTSATDSLRPSQSFAVLLEDHRTSSSTRRFTEPSSFWHRPTHTASEWHRSSSGAQEAGSDELLQQWLQQVSKHQDDLLRDQRLVNQATKVVLERAFDAATQGNLEAANTKTRQALDMETARRTAGLQLLLDAETAKNAELDAEMAEAMQSGRTLMEEIQATLASTENELRAEKAKVQALVSKSEAESEERSAQLLDRGPRETRSSATSSTSSSSDEAKAVQDRDIINQELEERTAELVASNEAAEAREAVNRELEARIAELEASNEERKHELNELGHRRSADAETFRSMQQELADYAAYAQSQERRVAEQQEQLELEAANFKEAMAASEAKSNSLEQRIAESPDTSKASPSKWNILPRYLRGLRRGQSGGKLGETSSEMPGEVPQEAALLEKVTEYAARVESEEEDMVVQKKKMEAEEDSLREAMEASDHRNKNLEQLVLELREAHHLELNEQGSQSREGELLDEVQELTDQIARIEKEAEKAYGDQVRAQEELEQRTATLVALNEARRAQLSEQGSRDGELLDKVQELTDLVAHTRNEELSVVAELKMKMAIEDAKVEEAMRATEARAAELEEHVSELEALQEVTLVEHQDASGLQAKEKEELLERMQRLTESEALAESEVQESRHLREREQSGSAARLASLQQEYEEAELLAARAAQEASLQLQSAEAALEALRVERLQKGSLEAQVADLQQELNSKKDLTNSTAPSQRSVGNADGDGVEDASIISDALQEADHGEQDIGEGWQWLEDLAEWQRAMEELAREREEASLEMQEEMVAVAAEAEQAPNMAEQARERAELEGSVAELQQQLLDREAAAKAALARQTVLREELQAAIEQLAIGDAAVQERVAEALQVSDDADALGTAEKIIAQYMQRAKDTEMLTSRRITAAAGAALQASQHSPKDTEAVEQIRHELLLYTTQLLDAEHRTQAVTEAAEQAMEHAAEQQQLSLQAAETEMMRHLERTLAVRHEEIGQVEAAANAAVKIAESFASQEGMLRASHAELESAASARVAAQIAESTAGQSELAEAVSDREAKLVALREELFEEQRRNEDMHRRLEEAGVGSVAAQREVAAAAGADAARQVLYEHLSEILRDRSSALNAAEASLESERLRCSELQQELADASIREEQVAEANAPEQEGREFAENLLRQLLRKAAEEEAASVALQHQVAAQSEEQAEGLRSLRSELATEQRRCVTMEEELAAAFARQASAANLASAEAEDLAVLKSKVTEMQEQVAEANVRGAVAASAEAAARAAIERAEAKAKEEEEVSKNLRERLQVAAEKLTEHLQEQLRDRADEKVRSVALVQAQIERDKLQGELEELERQYAKLLEVASAKATATSEHSSPRSRDDYKDELELVSSGDGALDMARSDISLGRGSQGENPASPVGSPSKVRERLPAFSNEQAGGSSSAGSDAEDEVERSTAEGGWPALPAPTEVPANTEHQQRSLGTPVGNGTSAKRSVDVNVTRPGPPRRRGPFAQRGSSSL